jgi:hypothetical protein
VIDAGKGPVFADDFGLRSFHATILTARDRTWE